jgi:non-ribosomal peptide synthetase component E (peptide arylation enzyme)
MTNETHLVSFVKGGSWRTSRREEDFSYTMKRSLELLFRMGKRTAFLGKMELDHNFGLAQLWLRR